MNGIKSLLSAAIACAALTGCGGEKPAAKGPAPIEIKVAEVVRADVPLSMEFVGQTKGSIDAEIRARVEGVVTAIHFEEGKEVKEGQLLYTIDSAPYKAKVAEQQAKVAEAETKHVRAVSDLKRIKPLVEMKALSERDLDSAVAIEGASRGAVDAAKAALESAQIELGYCEIKSPTTGIIGFTKAKVGEFVGRAPNPVVLDTVSNLDPIHVQIAVSEADYLYFARLKEKELAEGADPKAKRSLTLTLADGKDYPQTGLVASVNREIDPKTGTLSVETAFPNPNNLLRPGQFAKVRTIAETMKGALVVPKKSVREIQGQNQLMVIKKDNTVEVRNVELGRLIGDQQVIAKGVEEKELVALEGQDRLKTGSSVSPKLAS